jgi:penicillin-binding protein 2
METSRVGEHQEILIQRLRVLGIAAGALFLGVGVGYWYAQVVRYTEYRQLAENNRLRVARVRAPRGVIEDRAGRALAENVPSYNLQLSGERGGVPIEESLGFASEILGLEPAELHRRAEAGTVDAALLAEDLDLVQLAHFEAAALEHPEFRIEVVQRRLYRHGGQTAHLLGYLGEVGQQELGQALPDLRAGDLIGKEGVEQAFDRRLRGQDGRQVAIVDSRGRVIAQPSREPASPGERLRLSIDLELQQEAELQLSGKVGALVALDPRDGALRALYSAPSFDPNVFSRRLGREEWQTLISSPHDPLQNRALESAYPPGSVFKIVMALAGLEEGTVDTSTRAYCRGSVRLHGRPRRCWKRGGHGSVGVQDALKHSCDVFFYLEGQELGIERMARWARHLGLGRPTGIDVPGEKAGLVPDADWSQRVRGQPWYPGETISVAIGQGPILTTPLQVAVMLAVVANGGLLVTPYVLPGDAKPPEPLGLSPAHVALVREALRSVVEEGGTAARIRLPGIEVAGKTGTAQVIEQKTWIDSNQLAFEQRDHAWFASYAPADQPELVVVAFIEHGGHGASVAAPMVKALYEKYFDLKTARTARSAG